MLDEGARQLRCPNGDGAKDAPEGEEEVDARVARAGDTTSVDALVALFPRPLAPALDELETRALLRFLVEKLRVYQQQVAAVFHQQQSQPSASAARRSVDKAKGLELPPISASKSPAKAKAVATTTTTTSPLKRRAFFAHVSAAVAREEAAATSPRAAPSPTSGVHPELLAMATGQFNFLAPSAATSKLRSAAASPTKAAPSPSPSPTRRSKPTTKRAKAVTLLTTLAPSDSTAELLTPWPSGEEEGEGGGGGQEEDAPVAAEGDQ